MNFYFIVDTSFSMLQVCNRYSLLDVAKMIVERFTDMRIKTQESKFDKYYLSPTIDNPESNYVSYILPNDSSIFQIQLRTLQVCPKNDVSKAIVNAYKVLNESRLLNQSDNFWGGRDALKTDNSIIILLTDGTDSGYVDILNNFFQSEVNICRWDQQLSILLLNPYDSRNKYIKSRQAPKYYSKLLDFANSLGGTCSILDSIETIPDFVDMFNSKVKHKIMMNIKSIRLENYNFDASFHKKIGDCSKESAVELETLKDLNLKTRLIVKFAQNQLSNRSQMFAKIPFPEDPLYANTSKYFNRQEIEMTFRADSFFYKQPNYYIDFSKYLTLKLSQDLPYERYEVDDSCDLFHQVREYFKNNSLTKTYIPVYFFNKYSNPSQGRMELFALLRYVRSELDSQIGIDLMIYPLNLHEFDEIWDDTAKLSMNMRVKNELPNELIQKMQNYFNKVPYYYSQYLFNQLSTRKLGDGLNRKWNFFTKFHVLVQQNIELISYQNNLKKFVQETKINEKNAIDRKIEGFKIELLKNLNQGIIFPKKEAVHDDVEIIVGNKNISLLDKLFDAREILFASKPKKQSVAEQEYKKVAVSKMSSYHETFSKMAPLKNHHEDELDAPYQKEPIPFGNPFRYRLKSNDERDESNEFLTQFLDKPQLERSKSERAITKHELKKLDSKLKGMKRTFSLKSLQLALEDTSKSDNLSTDDGEERKEFTKLIESKPYEVIPTSTSSKKYINPVYFIAQNADIFRKFSILVKSPIQPSQNLSPQDKLKKEIKEAIEKLNINDRPELKQKVLEKFKDILRVNNHRVDGLS